MPTPAYPAASSAYPSQQSSAYPSTAGGAGYPGYNPGAAGNYPPQYPAQSTTTTPATGAYPGYPSSSNPPYPAGELWKENRSRQRLR